MKTLEQLMSMQGRVCLITGGAGHIGLALAETLAELGASVCLVDRDTEALDRTAALLGKHNDVEIVKLEADLASEDQRKAIPDRVSKRCGRLDVLINNAAFTGDTALDGWVGELEEQSLSVWRDAFEVNLTAAFHLSQLTAPMLASAGHGAIVNMASIYGAVGPDLALYEGTEMGSPAAYAASKGGLIQLTRWLATVLAPEIRVNCVSPGGVFRQQPEAFVQRYVERTPLGRMAKEEDLKGAIAFLASDLSGYVTGQNLFVDGGWTSW